MGGYIRMDKDLADDPRVLALAERIARELKQLIDAASDADFEAAIRGLACNAALGSLFRLWRYGDTHLGRHNRLKGALHGTALMAEVTALPTGVLRDFPGEWLKLHADGSVELPDYSAKNNLIDRDLRREQTRARVERFRKRQREKAGKGNAQNGVTHEALQRDGSVTTGTGPGTGTGTGTTVPGTVPGSASPPVPEGPARRTYEQDFEARFGTAPAKALSAKALAAKGRGG